MALLLVNFFNPFAPGMFSEKYELKLVEPFYDHCLALKTSHSGDVTSGTRELDLHGRLQAVLETNGFKPVCAQIKMLQIGSLWYVICPRQSKLLSIMGGILSNMGKF